MSEGKPPIDDCHVELRDKSIPSNCKHQSVINGAYDGPPDDNDKLSRQLRNEEIEIVTPETHPEYFVPVAPDGGWSWIILFATFLNFFIIDGIFFSVGLLMVEWVDHFEASKTKVSLISSLMLGCYQMIGPFAAALTNKFGCRSVALFGCILASVSIFISALMPTVNGLIITFGILAGSAFGLIYLPALIAVSFYFNRKRGLASGIAVTGTPFGAVIFGPLAGYLIQLYGWSCTLIFFSAFMLHGICLSCLYRPLKPLNKLESLDLSKETDESITELIEEIQSNLMIASNTYIKSNQFINSSNRIGQPLYKLDEGNEENEQKSYSTIGAYQNNLNKQSVHNEVQKMNQRKEDAKKYEDEKKEETIKTTKSSELTLLNQMVSEQVDESNLMDSSSASHHLSSVSNTVSKDQIISMQEDQLLPESVDEKQSIDAQDRKQNLTDDQPPGRSSYELSSKLTHFLANDRSRETGPSSYVFSTPCLSVNQAYDEQTSNRSNKFLHDVYNTKIINPLKSRRLLRPVVSRRRHLSHNLTPSIPTIVEDQELTKSSAHDQLHTATTTTNNINNILSHDFSSTITVANLGRDRHRISVDPNVINSGLIRGSITSALTNYPQKLEIYKMDSKPVLVALPHESITIQDYSRPLYRSDIFFSGNPIAQIPNDHITLMNKMKSTGTIDKKTQSKLSDTCHMTNSCLTVPVSDTTDHSHIDNSYGGERESAFFQSQPNWMESLIVSLTSIPLPNDETRGLVHSKQNLDEKLHKSFIDYNNRMHDEVDSTDISHEICDNDVVNKRDDNLESTLTINDNRLCEFCLTSLCRLRDCRLWPDWCCSCYFTGQKQIYHRVNKEFPNHQPESDMMIDETSIHDGDYENDDDLIKIKRCTSPVQCKCVSLKPMLDVLGTMLDLSLLLKPKYLILWISNLIGLLGKLIMYNFLMN
ncbi:Monocarboxylate transporter 14 [Schistosoma japonicum]|uniref:Monocarboxylate transporter 14 n=1 Tax=Schistosoma japonicum TaxID=6182 RepID=A0A4Z2DA93_SCHJA|nr:Monocarboxylate transporter 14 [Schistosoma japonicum]